MVRRPHNRRSSKARRLGPGAGPRLAGHPEVRGAGRAQAPVPLGKPPMERPQTLLCLLHVVLPALVGRPRRAVSQAERRTAGSSSWTQVEMRGRLRGSLCGQTAWETVCVQRKPSLAPWLKAKDACGCLSRHRRP